MVDGSRPRVLIVGLVRFGIVAAIAATVFFAVTLLSGMAQAQPSSPCWLLTPPDISSVLRTHVAAGLTDRALTPGDPTARCTFAGTSAAAVVIVQVHVHANRYPPSRFPTSRVPGLGVPAVASPGNIYFLAAGQYVQVTASYAGGRVAKQAQLVALARRVIGRLAPR